MLTYIGISGIAITIFTLSLLLSKEKKKLTDWMLSGWLASLGCNQAFFLWSGSNAHSLPFFLDLTGMGMVLIHTPLLFLFVKYAFKQQIPIIELWHLLPFLLFMAAIGIFSILRPDAVSVHDGFLTFTGNRHFLLDQYGLYFAIVAGGYTFAAWHKIRSRKQEIDQFYSNQSREVFFWLQKWIIAAVVFFLITWLFIEFSLWKEQVDIAGVFPVVSNFITIYIFYISFIGNRYSRVFHDTIPEIRINHDKGEPGIIENDDALREHSHRIKEVMRTQKLFLNPDLTLPELANICDLTTVKTSQALNRVLGKNFYTFVNEYRADQFIHDLKNPEFNHLSLIGLAYKCGFQSKSTFNKFFKSYTDYTPSQYRKKILEKGPAE